MVLAGEIVWFIKDEIQEGEVSEWLKEHAWKVCIPERVSRVRIPPSPPKLKTLRIVAFSRSLSFITKWVVISSPYKIVDLLSLSFFHLT
jgi:hypothetical protein